MVFAPELLSQGAIADWEPSISMLSRRVSLRNVLRFSCLAVSSIIVDI